MTRKLFLPLSLALLIFQARPAEKFALTIDNIMRGPALVGYEPAQVRWSFDSRTLYFQWKQASDKLDAPMDTYAVNRDGSGLRKLTDDEIKLLPPAGGDPSRDRRYTVYTSDGDIHIYDNTTGKIQQITKTADQESNPHFLPDGKRIYFTRAGNLYVMSLENGFLEQMTDIQPPRPPPLPPHPRQVDGAAGVDSAEAAARAAEAALPLPPIPPHDTRERQPGVSEEGTEGSLRNCPRPRGPPRGGRRQKEEGARGAQSLHPAGASDSRESPAFARQQIRHRHRDRSRQRQEQHRPELDHRFGLHRGHPRRSNVGDSQSRIRLAMIDAQTGEVKWVDHGQKAGTAERDVQLGQPIWNEDGTSAVVVGRAADFKDRWIFALDPATGKTRVLAAHPRQRLGGRSRRQHRSAG